MPSLHQIMYAVIVMAIVSANQDHPHFFKCEDLQIGQYPLPVFTIVRSQSLGAANMAVKYKEALKKILPIIYII